MSETTKDWSIPNEKEEIDVPDELFELFNSFGHQFNFVLYAGKNYGIAAAHMVQAAQKFFTPVWKPISEIGSKELQSILVTDGKIVLAGGFYLGPDKFCTNGNEALGIPVVCMNIDTFTHFQPAPPPFVNDKASVPVAETLTVVLADEVEIVDYRNFLQREFGVVALHKQPRVEIIEKVKEYCNLNGIYFVEYTGKQSNLIEWQKQAAAAGYSKLMIES